MAGLLALLPSAVECEEWVKPILVEEGGTECWQLLVASLSGLQGMEGAKRSGAEAAAREVCERCWTALHGGDWRRVNGECSALSFTCCS